MFLYLGRCSRALRVCLVGALIALIAVVPVAPADAQALGLDDFVLLADDQVHIRSGVNVASGDVGARTDAFATDPEVRLDSNAMVSGVGSTTYGDRLQMAGGTSVENAVYNTKQGPGTVAGTVTTPLTLPLDVELPTVPSASPGTSDVTVPFNGSVTLQPGAYATLTAAPGATVVLEAGAYDFGVWDLRSNVTVTANGPVTVVIEDWLEGDSGLTLTGATGVDPWDVSITVLGTDASAPSQAVATLSGDVAAHVYAPNGSLWVGTTGTTATGQFLGKRVRAVGGTFTLATDTTGGGGGGGDTQAPTIDVTSPAAEETVVDVVAIVADASDNTGVTQVEFYADGALIGTATSPEPDGTWSVDWDLSSTEPGYTSVTAVAYDSAANQTTSAPVVVIVYRDLEFAPATSVTLSTPVGLDTLAQVLDTAGLDPVQLQYPGGIYATTFLPLEDSLSVLSALGVGNPAITFFEVRGQVEATDLGSLASSIDTIVTYDPEDQEPAGEAPDMVVPESDGLITPQAVNPGSGIDWWPDNGRLELAESTPVVLVDGLPVSVERPVASITQQFSWDETSPLNFQSDAWPDKKVLDIQVELENDARSGTRPGCNPFTEDDFWAYHEFVLATHTFPEDSLPYFDLRELTWFSDCSRVEFTIGAMHPWNITDNVTHTVTFTATRGNLESSPLGFKMESLVNDCTSPFITWAVGIDSARCVSIHSYPFAGGEEHAANILPLALDPPEEAPTCFYWIKPANGQPPAPYDEEHVGIGCNVS